MGETVITVENVKKRYKDHDVLKGINFKVKRGSIFALLGSNGAGKTTTVRILSTLLKPDGGKVQISNFDIVDQADDVRGEISLTGQYAAVDELMTGRENLRLIGKLYHLVDVNSKADELLERFQLTDAANRRVATYSGGMRRRLDIAMGLVGNPSIIFLDEPTTGLDPQSRIAMWKFIKELTLTGVTVFLTTQYLEEAEQLADQIAILDEGKIVAEGTAEELKKLLPHEFVELGFNNEDELHQAHRVLEDFYTKINENDMILAIAIDGDVKELTHILNTLEGSDISVASFEQRSSSLEDVFLTIIDKNKEKEGSQ